ncbi:MAG TPA: M24 family metallopeptidase [Mycobacteriales bacterium]|jgi:Xaa-Pro aminopeptidase|nr:M24 family metallopeptidase [Mycobacteriales bacterium]
MYAERHRRLSRFLDEHELDALVLRRPANVAWAGEGARTHIDMSGELGVASLVVTREGTRVVTSRIEAERLAAEELTDPAYEWTVLDWIEDATDHLPAGERVGVDGLLPGRRDVTAELEVARRSLLPQEVALYRALGRDSAEALTAAVTGCGPGDSEFEWAARAAAEVTARGADPLVLLVAGADRIARYRHPLPTAAPAGDLVMVVVCARRHGLWANLTRFVAHRPLTADETDAQERLLRVEATFLDATRPGQLVRDTFAAGTAAYGEHGFDAEEWRKHHQGGPTGYLSRDHLATPACTEAVDDAQAFAWNPSVPGLKVEDTVLATAAGPEVLTLDPAWPLQEVDGRPRPLVLIR